MKILSNEFLKIDYGISQLEAFETLDITTKELKEFPVPISLITMPGYSSDKYVGVHPNFPSLFASLICCRPESFSNYVNSYCDEFDYSCKLKELLNDDSFNDDLMSRKDVDRVDYLFRFLNSHRQEVKEFVSLLKIRRPLELEKPLYDISYILEGHIKYYVSYLSVININAFDPSITVLSDHRYTGTFNVDVGVTLPSNYKSIIDSNAQNARLFSLDVAIATVIKELNKEDSKLFSTYRVGQFYANEITFNSILYDLIYKLIDDEWGI